MAGKKIEKVDRNRHVLEYLEYYISFGHSPRFAVMINGAWGIGKTFLIKKILEKHFADRKDEYVYVSLYGLSTIDEIDDAIIAAIYPILGSKGVRVAGRIAKSALKYFSVESDFQLKDVLNKYKANLYVFDDLERCELKPINRVLGYINEFVEHDDCKVIIIANEAEIKNGQNYAKRREKLIGFTLEVQSSFEDALESFTSLVSDIKARDFLKKKSGDISEIYNQSGLNNLRVLQQTIWDFERLYAVFSSSHRANDAAMNAALRIFFALSIELKSGRVLAVDLKGRVGGLAAAMARSNAGSELTRLQIAEKLYSGTDLGDSILSNEILINILSKGVVNKEDVQRSLDASAYFISAQNEPPWRTLWYSLERSHDEANKAFIEVESQFINRHFVEIGEILHVFGMRFWLSEIGLLSKSRSDLVGEGIDYIDDLYEQGRLLELPLNHSDGLNFDSYAGLGIQEAKTLEYRELYNYLREKRRQVFKDSFPQKSDVLLQELEIDSGLFYRRLCLTNSSDNIYYQVPILAAISPEIFVDAVLKQKYFDQRTILSVFETRYEADRLESVLSDEKVWIYKVRDCLLLRSNEVDFFEKIRIQKYLEWYFDSFLKKSDGSDFFDPD